MTPYIIARRRDRCEQWAMTEFSEVIEYVRKDIIKMPPGGDTMRVVLRFTAPSWEDARRVYEWSMVHLRNSSRKKLVHWKEAKIMIGQERRHVQMAKNKD